MRTLDLDGLEAEAGAYDAAVLSSDDVDRFCSSSDWMLPAARGLLAPRSPFVRALEHGYLALARRESNGRAILEPLEAMWLFGCPLVGSDVRRLALEAAEACRGVDAPLALSGLGPSTPRLAAVAQAFLPRWEIHLARETERRVASLNGGVDGFLSRRPAGLRQALRRAGRRAANAGIRFDLIIPDQTNSRYSRKLWIRRA